MVNEKNVNKKEEAKIIKMIHLYTDAYNTLRLFLTNIEDKRTNINVKHFIDYIKQIIKLDNKDVKDVFIHIDNFEEKLEDLIREMSYILSACYKYISDESWYVLKNLDYILGVLDYGSDNLLYIYSKIEECNADFKKLIKLYNRFKNKVDNTKDISLYGIIFALGYYIEVNKDLLLNDKMKRVKENLQYIAKNIGFIDETNEISILQKI